MEWHGVPYECPQKSMGLPWGYFTPEKLWSFFTLLITGVFLDHLVPGNTVDLGLPPFHSALRSSKLTWLAMANINQIWRRISSKKMISQPLHVTSAQGPVGFLGGLRDNLTKSHKTAFFLSPVPSIPTATEATTKICSIHGGVPWRWNGGQFNEWKTTANTSCQFLCFIKMVATWPWFVPIYYLSGN